MKVVITPKTSEHGHTRSFLDPVGQGVSQEQMQKLREHLRRMGKCVQCGTPLQPGDTACRSCGLDRAGQVEDVGIFVGKAPSADRSKEQDHKRFQPPSEPSSPPPIGRPAPERPWEQAPTAAEQQNSGYTGTYHAHGSVDIEEPQALPEVKLCPYCCEEIKYAAIKCKHCGEFLELRPPLTE